MIELSSLETSHLKTVKQTSSSSCGSRKRLFSFLVKRHYSARANRQKPAIFS